ncbi:MAG: hypothetical protein R3B13_08785 [Polyangiaceae bacterium]
MQQMPQQYQYPPQQQMAPQPAGPAVAPAREPKRNIILIGIGLFLLIFIALPVFGLFAYNLYQYMTIEDKFADLPSYARSFGVEIVKRAAMKRMMIFGPVSGVFGLVGLVLAGLGMRKK